MIGDPFLNYFALFLLIFVIVVLFYGIIAIHDIPATASTHGRSGLKAACFEADPQAHEAFPKYRKSITTTCSTPTLRRS
jgi:hypothetical protein